MRAALRTLALGLALQAMSAAVRTSAHGCNVRRTLRKPFRGCSKSSSLVIMLGLLRGNEDQEKGTAADCSAVL